MGVREKAESCLDLMFPDLSSALDENVSTADSPVYLAIFLAFSTLGPVVGYFASGQLLKVSYHGVRNDYSTKSLVN